MWKVLRSYLALQRSILLGARTLLGAPGIATSSKKLLGAPGLTTRSKDATRVHTVLKLMPIKTLTAKPWSIVELANIDGLTKS